MQRPRADLNLQFFTTSLISLPVSQICRRSINPEKKNKKKETHPPIAGLVNSQELLDLN